MIILIAFIVVSIGILYFLKPKPDQMHSTGTVLDTSVLIDGRLERLLEAGVVAEPLLIPSRVIAEINEFKDSNSKKYAAQKQASVAALKLLQTVSGLEHDEEYNDVDADEQVVLLAIKHRYVVASLDKEVLANARNKNLQTFSPDQLFAASRPPMKVGDILKIKLRYGGEKDWTIGLSPHGEVVKVKRAKSHIGTTKQVVITHISDRGNYRVIESKLAN